MQNLLGGREGLKHGKLASWKTKLSRSRRSETFLSLDFLIGTKSYDTVPYQSRVNFNQKKSYPNWRVTLSTQISHINFFIQKRYPKKVLSKDLLDIFYITLYTKSDHPKIYNYATYSSNFINENI